MSGTPLLPSSERTKRSPRLGQILASWASCVVLLLAAPDVLAQDGPPPGETEPPADAEADEAPAEEAPEDTESDEEAPSEDSSVDESPEGDAPQTESEDAEEDAQPSAGEAAPEEEEQASEEDPESGSGAEGKGEEDVGAAQEEGEEPELPAVPETPEPAGGADTDPVPPSAPATDGASQSEKPEQPKIKWREKPLRTTVGISPTVRDLGNEADIFIDDEEKVERKSKTWKLDAKGFLRGTARFSLGPKNSGQSGSELHAPARIPGLSSGDWDHIGVVPNPSAKAFFSAGTPTVNLNVIIGGQPPIDEGYPNPKEAGWFLDSFLVLKFPRVFGHKGGIAVTAGSFGHRYGNAGKKTTGYYRTYLFGKTHQTGVVYTADIDLTPHWELIFEHGFGAKDNVVPWINPSEPTRPRADYLQGQGDLPRGSNFVHHAHLQLRNDYWLRLGSHLMTSWSPNDRAFYEGDRAEEARLTISGVEANIDLPTGSGYLGYAHMAAKDVLPLSNAIQTLHASRGADIKKIYFGFRDRLTGHTPSNDSGTVDSVLFQYILKMANVAHMANDLDLGLFAMYSHVNSPIEDPNITTQENLRYDRLKWGAEVMYELAPFMRGGLRFDNVNSEIQNMDRSFSAISPRLFFFSKKGSKETVVVNYSYFLYGSEVYPGSPYRELAVSPDRHFFGISALMSL